MHDNVEPSEEASDKIPLIPRLAEFSDIEEARTLLQS